MIIFNFLKNLLKLAEAVLLLRIVLKALAASANSFFVAQFYRVTDWLVWPFRGIFTDIKFSNGVIDLTTIAAMVVYAFFIYLVLRLIKIFRSK